MHMHHESASPVLLASLTRMLSVCVNMYVYLRIYIYIYLHIHNVYIRIYIYIHEIGCFQSQLEPANVGDMSN